MINRIVATVLLAVSALSAQTFESATIKPSTATAAAQSGTLTGATDNVRTWTGTTLAALLAQAYAVRPDQVRGPNWLAEQRFDITTTLPAPVTPTDMPVMLQHLLTDRFHINLHEDTRPVTFYALVQAKGGAKLKTSESPDIGATVDLNNEFIELKDYTMVRFAEFLTTNMHQPTVDETGLKGTYYIKLYVSMADIKTAKAMVAIRQLGINFEKRTAPGKLVVVDKADKVPSGN